jgi:hypothetical protein
MEIHTVSYHSLSFIAPVLVKPGVAAGLEGYHQPETGPLLIIA